MQHSANNNEVKLSEIPQELLDRNQWIAWKGEYKENGKMTKKPVNPSTGSFAKTNVPETWGSFAQAYKHYHENELDGIGFVFSEADPYLGIDLDECLDGALSPEMEKLVKNFNSYTEISPSGRGLHIIVKGKLPGRGLRKDKIEVYDKARFFTITGNRMADTPKQIAETEDVINLLYDNFLSPKTNETVDNKDIEKAVPTDNSSKFKALWQGDCQDYHSQSEADLALCQLLTHYTDNNPGAIDKLFRQSGLYRPKWDKPHYNDGKTYGQVTIQKAIETSVSKQQEETSTSTRRPEFSRTDLGNAERLVYYFGDKIRYCHAWKTWFIWDGCRWCPDETNQVKELAKDTVRKIYKEARKTDDDSKRQALAKHAVSSESESRIRSMVSLAQSDNKVAIKPDEFDKDRFLFNCLNGTLDLRTGRLFPHRKENYITKLARIHFDPYAKCPQWMSFLNRIMDKNGNLIEFLKRAVGYSLTGDVSEQCLFIFFGSGANGKSTFLRTVNMLMGDYSQQTATETLLVKQKGAIPNDIARLKGARFITASEAEAEQRLAESLIKQMTGGDIISARFLHQEWFDFEPTYKIFLGTNHKPVIKGTDYAIWRRIKLVPFEVTIPENERDGNLLDKLQDELSGILTWAVQGCMEWQNSGLGIPQEVFAATDEYKNEMDIISDFINECCIESPNCRVLFKDLYQVYKNWCDENGEYPLKKNAFSRRIGEKGYVQARMGKSGAKGWKGISMVEEFPPAQ